MLPIIICSVENVPKDVLTVDFRILRTTNPRLYATNVMSAINYWFRKRATRMFRNGATSFVLTEISMTRILHRSPNARNVISLARIAVQVPKLRACHAPSGIHKLVPNAWLMPPTNQVALIKIKLPLIHYPMTRLIAAVYRLIKYIHRTYARISTKL